MNGTNLLLIKKVKWQDDFIQFLTTWANFFAGKHTKKLAEIFVVDVVENGSKAIFTRPV